MEHIKLLLSIDVFRKNLKTYLYSELSLELIIYLSRYFCCCTVKRIILNLKYEYDRTFCHNFTSSNHLRFSISNMTFERVRFQQHPDSWRTHPCSNIRYCISTQLHLIVWFYLTNFAIWFKHFVKSAKSIEVMLDVKKLS